MNFLLAFWNLIDPFAVLDLVQRLGYIRLMDLAQGPDQFRRFSDELGWMAENPEILLLPYLFMLLVELNLGDRRSNSLK